MNKRKHPSHETGFISGEPSVAIRPSAISIDELMCPRFEPQACISSCGPHLVCEARDILRGRMVALKAGRVGDTTEGASAIEHEAAIAYYLPQDTGIIQHHDLTHGYTADGSKLIFLSMELISGGSLRRWLNEDQGSQSSENSAALSIFEKLCHAVAAMHSAGIIHLDLKPEHALLDGNEVKLCDFGAAHLSREVVEGHPVAAPSTNAGTAHYMAPECFWGLPARDLDVTADIYSLGIILFELLSPGHRRPFTGSYRRISRAHQNDALPDAPWLSQGMADVLTCCTAKEPSNRFQSVDDLLDALDSVMSISESPDNCLKDDPTATPDRDDNVVVDTVPPPGNAYSDRNIESARLLLSDAQNNMDTGDLHELLSLVADATELAPHLPELYAVCARLSYRTEVFNRNIDACREAAACGQITAAVEYAKRAARANPGSIEATDLVHRMELKTHSIEERKAAMMEAAIGGDSDLALRIARDLDNEGVPA